MNAIIFEAHPGFFPDTGTPYNHTNLYNYTAAINEYFNLYIDNLILPQNSGLALAAKIPNINDSAAGLSHLELKKELFEITQMLNKTKKDLNLKVNHPDLYNAHRTCIHNISLVCAHLIRLPQLQVVQN